MEKIDVFKNISLTDLPNEKWKPLIGYEGIYEVSSLGRIKSLPRFRGSGSGGYYTKYRILKQKLDKNKYLSVMLCKDSIKIRLRVHRLVCQAFKRNFENKPQVNHKNGIKHDNRAINLEWNTCSENGKHSFKLDRKIGACWAGKTGSSHNLSKPVLQYTLDGVFVREYECTMEVERLNSFKRTCIGKCCNNKSKTAYGFVWKFKECERFPKLKQFTPNGEFVKEWDRIKDAMSEFNISSRIMRKYIDTSEIVKGFIWKR